jgi:hypothetical protein
MEIRGTTAPLTRLVILASYLVLHFNLTELLLIAGGRAIMFIHLPRHTAPQLALALEAVLSLAFILQTHRQANIA